MLPEFQNNMHVNKKVGKETLNYNIKEVFQFNLF